MKMRWIWTMALVMSAWVAIPSCGPDQSSPEPCWPGYTLCGQACVSLATSLDHCGACDVVCWAGQDCVDGACVDAGGPGNGGASAGDAWPTAGATCTPDTTPDHDEDANIDLGTSHQRIAGFGGISVPGWIDDLTTQQVDQAFGNGPGQLGLSILRVRIPFDSGEFGREVPTAVRAISHGAIVLATPWTPPPQMKTNNNVVGGRLSPNSYGAYADHLLDFRDFMKSNGVPLYAISVQNEPDIDVDYESCYWSASEFVAWLNGHASRFGDTRLVVAESFNFSRSVTDAILNDASAEQHVDIIGGHIYGGGLSDYPLARQKGKEVWMTEHYTDSASPANAWPLALDVGKELHDCMSANFNAYIWWYIRRSYGLLTEDGNVSKRGYLMSQYSKFIRPGFVRVEASQPDVRNVYVTAYRGDGQLVVVAVNMATAEQTITLDIKRGCVDRLARYTTSRTKNVSDDGTVTLVDHEVEVTLEAQSVTTFVSE